jgi:hypothetical protein
VGDRAQRADPHPGRVADDARAGPEGHQLDVGVSGQRAGELDRVAFAATQQAPGAERGGGDVDDAHVLMVSLITLGDPGTLTGGYLYHRRIAALAPRFGARVRFVSVPAAPFPLPLAAGPLVLRRLARQRPDVSCSTASPPATWRRGCRPGGRAPRWSRSSTSRPGASTTAGSARRRRRCSTGGPTAAPPLLAASAALADDLAAAGLPRRGCGRPARAGRGPLPRRAPGDLRRGRRRRCCRSATGWRARGCSTCSTRSAGCRRTR